MKSIADFQVKHYTIVCLTIKFQIILLLLHIQKQQTYYCITMLNTLREEPTSSCLVWQLGDVKCNLCSHHKTARPTVHRCTPVSRVSGKTVLPASYSTYRTLATDRIW